MAKSEQEKAREEKKRKAEIDLRRGQRAEAILNDEIMVEAIEALRSDAINGLTSCETHDKDKLQYHRLMYEVTAEFIDKFMSLVRQGATAQRAIQEMELQEQPVSVRRDY